MAWLASLRSRVFAATAVGAGLPIAGALGWATARVARQAEVDIGRGLREAASLIDQFHRARLDTVRERALLVADVPMLKAALATADPPTIEPLAREYRDRGRSDVFVVADRDGRVLVSLGITQRRPAASAGDERPTFMVDEGRLLETLTVPILLAGDRVEVLGRLTLGFALDDALAARLRGLTGSHVAVAWDDRIRASTLPRVHDSALLAAASGTGVTRLDLGGEEYVALRQPVGPGGAPPFVLVLRSRAEALRPLGTVRTTLVVAALLAAAVSLLLSWAVARTVTRPLAALTDGMRAVAATGDLTRKIGPGGPWDDEDARLVARTFNTLTDSVARFQREATLRERLSALGRLSTVIAHEVRNPLMIIKGSLRTLRGEDMRPEEVREAATDIDREVARLDRIVGDVLDFARPLKIEATPTDLGGLCRDATAAVLGDGAAGFDLAIDPSMGPVVTDGERLRTVLVNLVANARDSLEARRPPAGDGAPRGAIGCRRLASGRVLLWVEDHGIGIAARDLPHVFEPYFTTKRTGTGLGLAIVRKIVEALAGVIRVESREGEGTRVEIELPEMGASPAAKEAS
jgi:signal transduction histidine kinase